jgi:hypothetical protein
MYLEFLAGEKVKIILAFPILHTQNKKKETFWGVAHINSIPYF